MNEPNRLHPVGTDQLLVGLMARIADMPPDQVVQSATIYADVLRVEAVRRATRLAIARINGDPRLSKRARAIVVAHIEVADAQWPSAPALTIVVKGGQATGNNDAA